MNTSTPLLWSGKPRQGIFLSASDGYLIPISIMWLSFIVFWTYSVFKVSNPPIIMMISGCIFCVVGIFLIGGRFIQDSFHRSNIEYKVYSDKVKILNNGSEIIIIPNSSSQLKLIKNNEKFGTISFSQIDFFAESPIGHWMPSYSKSTQFYQIEDSDLVFNLLIEQFVNVNKTTSVTN